MPKTILVVEDDPDVRDFETQVLAQEGFAVETVKTGPEALARLETKTYDGIVLDVSLPGGLDGYELARQIGGLKTNRRTPLIMITGGGDRQHGFAAGVMVFLNKPITVAGFRSAVHSVIQ